MNAYVYLRRIYASGERKRPKARPEASLSYSRCRLSLDDLKLNIDNNKINDIYQHLNG